jgi:hypothetical protein
MPGFWFRLVALGAMIGAVIRVEPGMDTVR